MLAESILGLGQHESKFWSVLECFWSPGHGEDMVHFAGFNGVTPTKNHAPNDKVNDESDLTFVALHVILTVSVPKWLEIEESKVVKHSTLMTTLSATSTRRKGFGGNCFA